MLFLIDLSCTLLQPDATRFRALDAAFATPANLWPISVSADAGIRWPRQIDGHAKNTRFTHSRRYEFPQCTTVSASSCIFSGTSRQRLVPFASAEPFTTSLADGRKSKAALIVAIDRPLRIDFYSEILLDIPELKGFLYVRRTQTDASEGCLDAIWARQWCWIRGCKLYMSAAIKQAEEAKIIDGKLPTVSRSGSSIVIQT